MNKRLQKCLEHIKGCFYWYSPAIGMEGDTVTDIVKETLKWGDENADEGNEDGNFLVRGEFVEQKDPSVGIFPHNMSNYTVNSFAFIAEAINMYGKRGGENDAHVKWLLKYIKMIVDRDLKTNGKTCMA